MTKAVMYWNQLQLIVKGHANSDGYGKDLVCAAVSMLTGALVGVLEEAEARGRTLFEWKEGDGELTIWADPNIGSEREVKSYFKMCVKGLKMLHDQYPKNVDIKEV